MNYSIVRYIIGKVLYFEAAFMGLPCVTAIILPGTQRLGIFLYCPVVYFTGLLAYAKASCK